MITQNKPILFLDIDGVLNSHQHIKKMGYKFDNPDYQIDPEAVKKLNLITDYTGAAIVVSSTWRLAFVREPEGLKKLKETMKFYNITGEVIGMTPDSFGTDYVAGINSIFDGSGGRVRGNEIQAWLNSNPGYDKFIIIDDNSDMAHLKDKLIMTDFEDGLQTKHVKAAQKMLGPKVYIK